MSTTNVRVSLRRACEEIEDICEHVPIEPAHEEALSGIARQIRYYVDGGRDDPEASLRPDPDSLDTIRDRIASLEREIEEGETVARLQRARDEVLVAVSAMNDRTEKQGGLDD